MGVPRNALSASPIPPRCTVQLKYSETISLTSSAVAARLTGDAWEFRPTNLYDIDFSGSGHQPYMYDQFAALYGRYRVDHVQMQIDSIPNPSTSMMVHVLAQGPSGGWSINGRESNSLIENVKCKTAYALNSAVVPPRSTFYFDVPDLLGVEKRAYESDISIYSAAMGAGPSRNLHVLLAASAFAGTSQTLQVVVTFILRAHLWDPVVFGQS